MIVNVSGSAIEDYVKTAEIINELRRGRSELLQLIGDLTVKIQKGGVG